jgi:hypothetical protein
MGATTRERLARSPTDVSWIMEIVHENGPETARRLHLPLGGLATDLDTEHGGIDVNKRDGTKQFGQLNVADLQL